MSATLMAYPPPSNGTSLSDELKYALGRKLFGTDGTTGGTIDVDAGLVPYLEGLRDGGIKDAGKLIKLIEKHGGMTLTWEH
jgi:hypothetical protein